MNTYSISINNKYQEIFVQHIKIILQNNNYPTIHIPKHRTKQNKNKTSNIIQKQKWATFTYVGKETRTIPRLFKNTNIKLAYKTKKYYTEPPAT
jgi:hypothetical protein